jgi:hypothetical protein
MKSGQHIHHVVKRCLAIRKDTEIGLLRAVFHSQISESQAPTHTCSDVLGSLPLSSTENS